MIPTEHLFPNLKPAAQVVAPVNFISMVTSRALKEAIPGKQFFSERFAILGENFLPLEADDVLAAVKAIPFLEGDLSGIESVMKHFVSALGRNDGVSWRGCQELLLNHVEVIRTVIACLLTEQPSRIGNAFRFEDGSQYKTDDPRLSLDAIGKRFSADAITMMRYFE